MKYLITTIAAAVLVGCGPPPPDISIHEAVNNGNVEAVKQHLAAGTDVNAKNKYETTPLHHAAIKGHMEIAELLIEKGADVNAKGAVMGGTPLHEAAITGSKEIVELLIANGADMNAKDLKRMTVLHKTTDKEILELLIDNGADVNGADVDTKDISVSTPLHRAAFEGRKEVAELFIAKGADVNAISFAGRTPLDEAQYIFEGYEEEMIVNKKVTADLLRKHGAKTAEELKAAGN